MESEQSQNFNERLSQWVASQGFWFQVRYSMAGSGTKGTAMFHLLSLGFRLLIFLLVASIAGWVYLVKRVDRPAFAAKIQDSLQAGLSGSESQMRGFSKVQGQLGISRFACQGGSGTFFSTLEARNVRCKMGLLDGLVGKWDPGVVSISRLDIDLRAGADDAAGATKVSEAFFKKSNSVLLNSFEVGEASLRWGYSERTQGSIEGSGLKLQRLDDGVKMIFHGGTFSQNWLRKLEIVDLVVVCDHDGITFEKADFRKGSGTVDMSGMKVIGGERPALRGVAKIRSIALEDILPATMRNFVEGSFSGDFQVSGSTNTMEGIGFNGLVKLDGQDMLAIRERIHILKALSVVDYSRNYHRVDFREGSFQLKTIGGGLELTNLSLKSDDLFTLQGSMRVRLPTPEETKQAVDQSVKGGVPLFIPEDGETEDTQTTEDSDNISLKRAALEAKRSKDGKQDIGSGSLFDKLGLSLEMRRLEEQASERLSRMLRYEGSFQITIPQDAFERTPRLAEQYPVDPNTHRIPIVVPIEGSLYEITLKQAEEVYLQGRR
ncbi:MAG: hypothetical protein ABI162_08935 [Luteolibacter sp.]